MIMVDHHTEVTKVRVMVEVSTDRFTVIDHPDKVKGTVEDPKDRGRVMTVDHPDKVKVMMPDSQDKVIIKVITEVREGTKTHTGMNPHTMRRIQTQAS